MKIPTNLPELYRTLVEKRPELAVEAMFTEPGEIFPMPIKVPMWYRGGEHERRRIHEEEAAALILSHWQEALPEGYWLTKSQDEPHSAIYVINSVGRDENDDMQLCEHTAYQPDPITALYEFHLEACE